MSTTTSKTARAASALKVGRGSRLRPAGFMVARTHAALGRGARVCTRPAARGCRCSVLPSHHVDPTRRRVCRPPSLSPPRRPAARPPPETCQSGVVLGGTAIFSALNGYTPHMAGAIDIMVVEQPDGSLKCSPFYGAAARGAAR